MILKIQMSIFIIIGLLGWHGFDSLLKKREQRVMIETLVDYSDLTSLQNIRVDI